MSRTARHYPVNRVKARHNNAKPYKRDHYCVKQNFYNAEIEVEIEIRK
jgi:hypothetical protein